MPRLARVVAPGSARHVTQRGNGRMQTFFGDEECATYAERLERLLDRLPARERQGVGMVSPDFKISEIPGAINNLLAASESYLLNQDRKACFDVCDAIKGLVSLMHEHVATCFYVRCWFMCENKTDG